MYTNQVQSLTAALSRIAEPQQVQAIVQSLANCAQPLTTRGPFTANNAASSAPPRGGIFRYPPNSGGVYQQPGTGDPVADWTNGSYPQDFPRLGGNVWNPQFFSPQAVNVFYPSAGTYWGGDTTYGDNYVNNVTNTNNYNDWYTQQFVDNSYTDFSTANNFTTNEYNQSVNNFAGDNYFDSTYVRNDTVNNNVTNLGDVTNESYVTNNGDVYNNANTYLTENKTYVTNNNTTEELSVYITNRVGASFIPTIGSVNIPTDACSGGLITVNFVPQTEKIKNCTGGTVEDDCTVTLQGNDVDVIVGYTVTATFAPTPAKKVPVRVVKDIQFT